MALIQLTATVCLVHQTACHATGWAVENVIQTSAKAITSTTLEPSYVMCVTCTAQLHPAAI
jgi:hypothetical protein